MRRTSAAATYADGQGLRQHPYAPDSERAYLDRGLAGPSDGAVLIDIDWRKNRQHRQQYEQEEGKPWPRDPVTRRPHDVAHKRALADGGTDTYDNIEPLHPDEHRRRHQESGDYARFAKRRWIAEAFGGKVAKAIPGFGIVSDVTGILSGRIRTDSFDNFTSDLFGWSSQEDRRKAQEHLQKQLNPNWRPGDPYVI